MSIAANVDQFKQSFREEAREVLVELEAALLELNENRSDAGLIGRVFRSLHTIKGSGSMFGFDRLAAFTHDLENAFDEIRNGRLEVSPGLIDLTLAALDCIKAMLEEDDREAADPQRNAEILNKVRRLTRADGGYPEHKAQPPEVSAPAAGVERVREWHIRFAPGPEMMRCGSDPLLMLRDLRLLGGLTARAVFDAVPPLAELDPERCYVAWEMVLKTAAGRDAICDAFIFVEDVCELSIEAAAHQTETDAATAPADSGDQTAVSLKETRASSGGRRDYDKPEAATSLRVPAAKLDQFVDLIGELVTVQARLGELAARRNDLEIAEVAEEVERLSSALRENSMNIRMLPIRATFEKFRRLVHDLARDLGKDVELTIEGADTELDKTVIEQLGDPLMHLIRNSMDHGIEMPDARLAHGKRRTANVHLFARQAGARVLIGVSDDGKGIDSAAVKNRAIERGLIAPDAALAEQEIFALIFQPGFSTAQQVTDISGRGVGMDVVRQKVEGLRGAIDVASIPGKGTSVTLRLPLTMAIIDGLLVRVDDASFVLPLASVLECIELSSADIERANGKHVANVRGELVPYIRLRSYFNIRSRRPELEQIMIVESGGGRYGFVVDQVLGNCQTMIKNLGRLYRHVQAVSGATILGDGTVALILDPERLVQEAVRDIVQRPRGHPMAHTAIERRREGSQARALAV